MNPIIILNSKNLLALYAIVKAESCWQMQGGYKAHFDPTMNRQQINIIKKHQKFAAECNWLQHLMGYTHFWNIRRK